MVKSFNKGSVKIGGDGYTASGILAIGNHLRMEIFTIFSN